MSSLRERTRPFATVAAYIRAEGGIATLLNDTRERCSAFITGFQNRFTVNDANPMQLLGLADVAAKAGDRALVRMALDTVIASGTCAHLAHYKLGRTALAANDLDTAAKHFRDAVELDADFPPAWMGWARAIHALGNSAGAVEKACRFASFNVRPTGKEDFAVVAALADFAFEANDRESSLPLFRLLEHIDKARPRDRLRIAECLITDRKYSEALVLLIDLAASGYAEPWCDRAMAICLGQLGRHREAMERAEYAVRARPDNAGFMATYLEILARSRDADLLSHALTAGPAPENSAAGTEIQARLLALDGNIEAAAALLADVQFNAAGRLFQVSIEIAYQAFAGGNVELAHRLATILSRLAPDDIRTSILRLDIYFREQEWEMATSLLAALPPELAELPAVLLKRFELASFMRLSSEAERLWAQLSPQAVDNKFLVVSRMRQLAEHKRWDDLVDLTLGWLDHEFNYAQIGYVIFRAAQITGRRKPLLAAIEALENWQSAAGLVRLHNALLADGATTLRDLDTALASPILMRDAALHRALATRRRVMARASMPKRRDALFLCTDKTYLCSTFVALQSAIGNAGTLSLDVFLIVDDDLVQAVADCANAYREAGVAVTIVPVSEIIANATALNPEYGLFTSGHVLSSAAYYRIFFAQHLARAGLYDRALYIDSDVLVLQELDDLLNSAMRDRPIAARLETPRPEVRRASKLHGIEDGSYFNSGVMLFDLRHPDLAAGLSHAVACIEDETTILLFHDQCALNLGFRGKVAPLELGWNWPVGETTRKVDVPPDAGILHFLDRPKPWSAAYGGECSALWFDAWRRLSETLGCAAAMSLMELSSA